MLPRYKDIMELIKKGSTIEAQEKIMELREAAIDLQEENQELRQRVNDLEEELREKNNLEYENGVYWLYTEDDAGDLLNRHGPFCQRCRDVNSKLVRLQDAGPFEWNCYECGKCYDKK